MQNETQFVTAAATKLNMKNEWMNELVLIYFGFFETL